MEASRARIPVWRVLKLSSGDTGVAWTRIVAEGLMSSGQSQGIS